MHIDKTQRTIDGCHVLVETTGDGTLHVDIMDDAGDGPIIHVDTDDAQWLRDILDRWLTPAQE